MQSSPHTLTPHVMDTTYQCNVYSLPLHRTEYHDYIRYYKKDYNYYTHCRGGISIGRLRVKDISFSKQKVWSHVYSESRISLSTVTMKVLVTGFILVLVASMFGGVMPSPSQENSYPIQKDAHPLQEDAHAQAFGGHHGSCLAQFIRCRINNLPGLYTV